MLGCARAVPALPALYRLCFGCRKVTLNIGRMTWHVLCSKTCIRCFGWFLQMIEGSYNLSVCVCCPCQQKAKRPIMRKLWHHCQRGRQLRPACWVQWLLCWREQEFFATPGFRSNRTVMESEDSSIGRKAILYCLSHRMGGLNHSFHSSPDLCTSSQTGSRDRDVIHLAGSDIPRFCVWVKSFYAFSFFFFFCHWKWEQK